MYQKCIVHVNDAFRLEGPSRKLSIKFPLNSPDADAELAGIPANSGRALESRFCIFEKWGWLIWQKVCYPRGVS